MLFLPFDLELERRPAEPEAQREGILPELAVVLYIDAAVSAEDHPFAVGELEHAFGDAGLPEQFHFHIFRREYEFPPLPFSGGPVFEGGSGTGRDRDFQILQIDFDRRRRDRLDFEPEPVRAERRERGPIFTVFGREVDRRGQGDGAIGVPVRPGRSDASGLPVAVNRGEPESENVPVERPRIHGLERFRQPGGIAGQGGEEEQRQQQELFHSSSFPHQNGVLRFPGMSPRMVAAACPSR